MRYKKQITIVAVLLIVTAGLILTRPDRYKTIDSGYRPVMGTMAHITVVTEDSHTAKKAFAAAFGEIARIEQLMSKYRSDSELYRLNNSPAGEPVEISPELFALIELAGEFYELTGGAFDITIGPVADLWQQAGSTGIKPAPEQIKAAKTKTGFDKLILNENNTTVTFAVEGMKLDLGGIAKGCAIDNAVRVLKESGIVGGLVDIGGDIRCFGEKPGNSDYWRIGLQNPRETGQIVLKLALDETSVATSGDYQRFVYIDGQKHSHIIDPRKADSAQGLSSVSVITARAARADALATAVTVMGTEKGLILINKLENTEAVIIESNNDDLILSENAEQYIIRLIKKYSCRGFAVNNPE